MGETELGVVHTNIVRAERSVVDALAQFGVATIHEAQGRLNLMRPYMRPAYHGARLCGSALTVLLQPGDNWMLHVAVEQAHEGDVVVAACTSKNADGFFGELLATSLRAHGAVGLIIDGGVRDVDDLERMQFPVFSRAIHAKGTVKASLGSVNVPIICGNVLVNPGDVVVGDTDGVVVVPRERAADVAEKSARREANEAEKRRRLGSGELGLDLNHMREPLAHLGLRYED